MNMGWLGARFRAKRALPLSPRPPRLAWPLPMRWTWLPRLHSDIHQSEAQPLRFWLVHVPMVLAIAGFFALPPVRAWTGADPSIFFVLVLVHLAGFAADVHFGLFRRCPTLHSTLIVSVNLLAATSIAILPGRVILPLWALYGMYVLLLTRNATVSPYVFVLVVGAPLLGGLVWELSGTIPFAETWPELLLISMTGAALYVSLAPSAEHQRQIQAELEAAKERERIAANLHDTVGSTLAEVALWHDVATLERGDEAQAAFQRARHRTGEALLELRMAVSAMTAGEIGAIELEALLRARVQAICEAAQARCRIDIETSSARLGGETAHHLSNLVTEAVSNAIRHGHPRMVEVELRYSPLCLRVRDDGKGFDPATARRGQGLASMRARASALGAQLRLHSAPASGTIVEVRSTRNALPR